MEPFPLIQLPFVSPLFDISLSADCTGLVSGIVGQRRNFILAVYPRESAHFAHIWTETNGIPLVPPIMRSRLANNFATGQNVMHVKTVVWVCSSTGSCSQRCAVKEGSLRVIRGYKLPHCGVFSSPENKIFSCNSVLFSIKQYNTLECSTCEVQFHFTVKKRTFMRNQGNADEALFEVCPFKRFLTSIILEWVTRLII